MKFTSDQAHETMKTNNPSIIAITGMPGAGKSTQGKSLALSTGFPVWYIGQPLLNECARQGLPATYANRMEMGRQMALFDESAPLKFISHSFAEMRKQFPYPKPVIFDAVRTISELEFLKDQCESVVLVAVLLGRDERIRRLTQRDGVSAEFALSRDQMEIGMTSTHGRKLSVGPVIAIADCYIHSTSRNAEASIPADIADLLSTLQCTAPFAATQTNMRPE